MDDNELVERLRWVSEWYFVDPVDGKAYASDDPLDAADRIEALSAENERLQFLCDLNAVPAGIIEDRGRMEERAAIVAYARGHRGNAWSRDVLYFAEKIEAGEHLK